MVELFASNAADHLAAAAHNLRGDGDKFLEQSVFASGLSPRSTLALGTLARKLWRAAFQQMVREATPRFQRDSSEQQGSMRMRFGVYFYAEPLKADAADALARPAKALPTKRGAPTRPTAQPRARSARR
jgi:hypothetical protein